MINFSSENIKTRLTMRQYTVQLLLRDDVFQDIDYIPDTMVSSTLKNIPIS